LPAVPAGLAGSFKEERLFTAMESHRATVSTPVFTGFSLDKNECWINDTGNNISAYGKWEPMFEPAFNGDL
jgi:hypothetical protein